MMDISLPGGLVDILMGPPEPPYRLVRPDVRSVDEALAWPHEQPWPHADVNSDDKRRQAVKRLLFMAWLVARRVATDGRA